MVMQTYSCSGCSLVDAIQSWKLNGAVLQNFETPWLNCIIFWWLSGVIISPVHNIETKFREMLIIFMIWVSSSHPWQICEVIMDHWQAVSRECDHYTFGNFLIKFNQTLPLDIEISRQDSFNKTSQSKH